ncbi:PTS beta-glucoside transporter subunit EIIBCA [Enterococcus ureilyticus]|uniref:PTS system sucrose-specific EIIBCA component n=1 Tax=Enterococcus ureilyticus TaxID=1131292 RepID=A0A1E5HEE3_9ENTE|nr:beta-glucoside-specific PTS transporter subunit IIABC [Enterococcus ureilyticus]MBM7689812.1 PTS system beta-glucosides-specific IIC component [Enterococcus ureilyticus]MBO0446070.1 PTS glucose transporter subunit IIA [Enterococcus ureilyticus]OEG23175.1 PTS beta-glucoside transporter subunit EIIBCA [Enterococcus ureilyticus]
MKYQTFNEDIIRLVGGKENIQAVVHCMTRLRFTLNDRSKADTEGLKALDGVIDVVSNNVAYQVIIGTHVSEVHAELISMLGIAPSSDEETEVKEKKNPLKAAMDLLSETMTPVIEPIIASGLLAGFLSLFSITGLISADSPTYQLLDSIRSAVFFFLPILIAMSCAKRLKASPYLAVALAATLVSSSINDVAGLSIFGIQLPQMVYANSFIPIILAVWFMGQLTVLLKKYVPKFLQYFLNPLLIMVICLPVTLLVFGPIGIWIGDGIGWFFEVLHNTFGSWIVVMLYAAFQPFLIMLGAGNFMMPLALNFVNKMGYDPIFLAAATISDLAVSGAMLGYFLRAKDSKQKQLFGTVSFSALMGVTEPAIYGAFIKYRRPFIAVMIGGGMGGLFAGLMNVKTYSIVWGLMGLPSYADNQDFSNLIFMIISVVVGFVAAGVAAYILGIPQEEKEVQSKEPLKETEQVSNTTLKKVPLASVVEGKLVPLAEINDQAFSTGALGKGLGIIPSDSQIVAPVAGEVSAVFPTKHAIGIKTEQGVEVLIHIGIDTVELDGKHFDTIVEQGDYVKQGQLLSTVDFEGIKNDGYDPTVIVVITNTMDYLDVIPATQENLFADDECLTVIL